MTGHIQTYLYPAAMKLRLSWGGMELSQEFAVDAAGRPRRGGRCVEGQDNLGWAAAVSAAAFSKLWDTLPATQDVDALVSLLPNPLKVLRILFYFIYLYLFFY